MFSTVLLHKIKPKICVLAKRIIGLLRECKIGIADSVAFCLSNAFHNKYPFVLFCFGINYRRIYRWCSYLMPQGVAYHNKSPKKVFSLKTTRNPKLSPIGKNFGFFSFGSPCWARTSDIMINSSVSKKSIGYFCPPFPMLSEIVDFMLSMDFEKVHS